MLHHVRDPQTGYPILPPGTALPGGWYVNGLIGAGGFGSVYVAQNGEVKSALKEFRPHPSLKPEALAERVEMEAHVVRSFSGHPCLPGYIDRFDIGETHFLAEQFVEGQTLARVLKAGADAYSLGEALAWLCILTRTLDHLHRRLLLYQDLKPANILITPARTPVLVDFGAARHYAGVAANPRLLFGSFGYVAPEILTNPNSQRDYRSDVYSLGCLCYTLLTGRILQRDQILGQRNITTPSKAMIQFRPECYNLPSGWLTQIDEMLLTALQPDPKDRLADLKWFFQRFQGLMISAGDTEQVDSVMRTVNDRLNEQDQLLDTIEDAEADPENICCDPETLLFAPIDVRADHITLPVSIWSKTGKPVRASVSAAGTGIEVVEKNIRAVEGRVRVRVMPRQVRGINHWTRGALILRLPSGLQRRIPVLIFVTSSASPYGNGAPLPPIPSDPRTEQTVDSGRLPGERLLLDDRLP